MGKTNIEYADQVSNPIFAQLRGDETSKIGTFCEKPDAEGTCKNCWAETLNLRFGNKLTFDKANRDKIEWKVRLKELIRMGNLDKKKPMSEKFKGLPLVVFCFDTFDIFQPSISDKMRDVVFDHYDQYTNLTLLVQTTYPAKMRNYFKARYGDHLPSHYFVGMSAGTQEFYQDNIHYLCSVKASRRYVIFEPLLERVDLRLSERWCDRTEIAHECETLADHITLFIVGGESGSGARPCNIEWIRSIVRQCKTADVKVFVKQLGTKPVDGSRMSFDHDKLPLKLENKKGGDIEEFPEDLQIREMP